MFAFARTLGEAKQGNLFAKNDPNDSKVSGKAKFSKRNKDNFEDAKNHVLEEYPGLIDDTDISFGDIGNKNIGQACYSDNCMTLTDRITNGDNYYQPETFYIFQEALIFVFDHLACS